MNIDLAETLKMLDDLKKDEIDLEGLSMGGKHIINSLEELEKATDYASMIEKRSHQYLIDAKNLLITAKKGGILDSVAYKNFSNQMLDFHEEDLQLSAMLFSFSVAFLSLIEAECNNNLPEEQLCIPFYKLKCEIHAIKKEIEKTFENFENWYNKLLEKIKAGIEQNSTTLPQTLNRFLKKFDKRLTFNIDEVLYFKIMSSLIE